jgi:PAS domain S-box-containing protein
MNYGEHPTRTGADLIERLVVAAHRMTEASTVGDMLQVSLETILNSVIALGGSRLAHVDNVTIVRADDPPTRSFSILSTWNRQPGHRGTSGSSAHEAQYALISGPSLDALAEGSELAFNDVSNIEEDPRFNNADRLAIRVARIRACAFVPLRVENRWLGWIAIGSHQPHVFSLDEIGLYHSLADEVGIVLSDDTFLAQLPTAKVDYLDSLVQNVGYSIITTDPAGVITRCNAAAEILYGFAAADLIGQRFSVRLTPPDCRTENDQWLQIALRDGRVVRGDTEAVDCHGRVFQATVTMSPIKDRSGGVIGIAIICVDISDQAALQNELQKERDLLEAILESTNDAILMVDAERSVVTANQQFEAFFNLRRYQLIQRSVDVLIEQAREQPDSPDEFANVLLSLSGDGSQSGAGDFAVPGAPPRTLVWYSAPVRAQDGAHVGRLFVFRDATREREADRTKTEFVSLVSHELRTPMTSIKGFTDMILDGDAGPVKPLVQEYLEIIKLNADRLIALINDILDVTRLESGRLQLQRTVCHVEDIIDSVVQALFPLIDERQQQLEVHAGPELPPVWVDRDRIAQVITNLLANATKYTPPDGELGIEARWVTDSEEMPPDAPPGVFIPAILIGVHDTGIGITPQDQARLFTRFFRTDQVAERQIAGTGLGLSIAKSFVELHGGHVWVQSVPEQGSSFYFTIPLMEGQ